MTNKTNIELNYKAMKTLLLSILVTLLLFAHENAGAKNLKAISDNDTMLIIVKKNLFNIHENQVNVYQSGNNTFAALPDTTRDIIIIFRNIEQINHHLLSENKNSIDRLNFWKDTGEVDRKPFVSNIYRG